MPIIQADGATRIAVLDTTGRGVEAANGSLRIRLVTGTSITGLHAADGSINCFLDDTQIQGGAYHPCGALRVTTNNGVGVRAPNGALRVGDLSPSNLFAAAEPGVWYDPSDVANTNWLYNLLLWTEQFDVSSVWGRSGTVSVTANSETAPNGTLTADTLLMPANLDRIAQVVSGLNAGSTYVLSIWLKGTAGQTFNVELGATALTVTLTGDWQRVSATNSGSTSYAVTLIRRSTTATSVFLWGAQVELGSTATTYQPITTVNAETIARYPLATLYQDSAGTTLVNAPNQPVGLMLSKDKGLVIGPQLVINGDFSSGTANWPITGGVGTTSVSSGQFTLSSTLTAFAAQSFVTVVGRTYQYSVTIISQNNVAFNGIRKADDNIASSNIVTLRAGLTDGAGTSTGVFVATATNTFIVIQANTGASITVDNISVKELPGNHATQSTSGSRPTYGIVPATGRRNLLTYSEQFDNAAWSKQGIGAATAPVVTANAGIAPDGTTTADRVQMSLGGGTTTGDISTINQAYSFSAGNYTSSFWIRSNTGADQTVQLTIEGVGITVFTVTPTWQRFSGIRNATGLSSNVALRLRGTFTGNTADIFVWGAQLETGSSATAYQQVVTAFEVTEANVASLSYISFDGIDDFMVTPTITPGTDKVQVFAGVRKLSDAAVGFLVGTTYTAVENGSFVITAPRTATAANYRFLSKGTVIADAFQSAGYPAPTTNILSGLSDISADFLQLRVNGILYSQVTSDQGTGNYLAYPINIGRNSGGTQPFNGQMYGLITRFGANLPAATIQNTEGWMSTKTGIAL